MKGWQSNAPERERERARELQTLTKTLIKSIQNLVESQCDQIWQLIVPLPKFYKSLANI